MFTTLLCLTALFTTALGKDESYLVSKMSDNFIKMMNGWIKQNVDDGKNLSMIWNESIADSIDEEMFLNNMPCDNTYNTSNTSKTSNVSNTTFKSSFYFNKSSIIICVRYGIKQ